MWPGVIKHFPTFQLINIRLSCIKTSIIILNYIYNLTSKTAYGTKIYLNILKNEYVYELPNTTSKKQIKSKY